MISIIIQQHQHLQHEYEQHKQQQQCYSPLPTTPLSNSPISNTRIMTHMVPLLPPPLSAAASTVSPSLTMHHYSNINTSSTRQIPPQPPPLH